jgi:hypothetical protein
VNRQVNATSPDFEIPMAYFETPVTAVTFGKDSGKKDLILPKMSLD